MLAEFISKIAELATSAAEPKRVNLPGRKILLAGVPDPGTGGPLIIDIPPNDRNYTVRDIDSLREAVDISTTADDAAFFVFWENGCLNVTAILNESERRDRVTLRILQSPEFLQLQKLVGSVPQREFVTALRGPLFHVAPAGLLETVRTLQFNRRNDGSRTIEHGRESLGRDVENVVQSKNGAIPETVHFAAPILSGIDFAKYSPTLNFAVELDAASEKLGLLPVGDTINEATEGGMRFVAELVRDAIPNSSVLIGEPNEKLPTN